MNPILFLDIDGVLNTKDNKEALFALWDISDTLYRSRDKFGVLFDERCVRWLEFIVLKTQCDIVISSDWKKDGLITVSEMWAFRKMLGTIVDITPDYVDIDLLSKYPSKTADRGYEIQQYIEDNNVKKYCIVDDRNDMLPHQNFVLVDSKFGLTMDTAKKIIKYLL